MRRRWVARGVVRWLRSRPERRMAVRNAMSNGHHSPGSSDPSRDMLERLKLRGEERLRRAAPFDAALAAFVAVVSAAIMFAVVGQDCLHDPICGSSAGGLGSSGQVCVCNEYGPWIWSRLVWLSLVSLALLGGPVFWSIRKLRRRRLWQ